MTRRHLAAAAATTLLAASGCARMPLRTSHLPPVPTSSSSTPTAPGRTSSPARWSGRGPTAGPPSPATTTGCGVGSRRCSTATPGFGRPPANAARSSSRRRPTLAPATPTGRSRSPPTTTATEGPSPRFHVPDSGIRVIEGLYPFRFGRSSDDPTTPFYGTLPVFDVRRRPTTTATAPPTPRSVPGRHRRVPRRGGRRPSTPVVPLRLIDGRRQPRRHRRRVRRRPRQRRRLLDRRHGRHPERHGRRSDRMRVEPLEADYDGDGATDIAADAQVRSTGLDIVVFADGTPSIEGVGQVASRPLRIGGQHPAANVLPHGDA